MKETKKERIEKITRIISIIGMCFGELVMVVLIVGWGFKLVGVI